MKLGFIKSRLRRIELIDRRRQKERRPYKRAHRNWVKLCDGEPAEVEKVTD